MAEYVEFKIEQLLPELVLLKRYGIFSEEEALDIKRNWEEHLYRIEKKTKVKEDFLAFIKYDLDLLARIKERRHKMNYHLNKQDIDFRIVTRIQNFYTQSLLVVFPYDMPLWYNYFGFCRKMKLPSAGSGALHDMTRIHGGKEMIWKFAADWEIESKNPDKARTWLMAGTRVHPTSNMLHLEHIKLELDFAKTALTERSKRKQEKDENTANKERKRILRGKCAEIAYQSAAKTITDFTFYADMFKLTENYPAANNLRDMVFNDIQTKFPTTDAAWEIRARLHMEGANQDESATVIDVEADSEIKRVTMKERIKRCIAVYEEAVKVNSTMSMWTYYLNFLYEINQIGQCKSVAAATMRRIIWKTGFEAALSKNMVSDIHYLHFIEHLRQMGGRNKKIQSLLMKGNDAHPSCAQLWFETVRYFLGREQIEDAMKYFRKANNCLMKNPAIEVLQLWKLMMVGIGSTNRCNMENLFWEGIQLRHDLGQLIKPKYLEWKIQRDGISEARKLLENPCMTNPPCLPFYQQLIRVECALPEPCLKSIRSYFETCTRHFGSTEVSVWLDYIKFELTLGDVTFVTKVHQRAVNALSEQQLQAFLQRYSNQDIQSLNQADIVMK